jgi:hypothetical protein
MAERNKHSYMVVKGGEVANTFSSFQIWDMAVHVSEALKINEGTLPCDEQLLINSMIDGNSVIVWDLKKNKLAAHARIKKGPLPDEIEFSSWVSLNGNGAGTEAFYAGVDLGKELGSGLKIVATVQDINEKARTIVRALGGTPERNLRGKTVFNISGVRR